MAENFVCVRLQFMNGVNLEQFQFEFDLTWMAFFQDAAGRTYMRYGGRDSSDSEAYLNKESLLRAMQQTLKLHEQGQVQANNGYEPVPESVRTPEDIPTMRGMIAARNDNCIHCHDVKIAELKHLGETNRLRKEMVFTYPSPGNLGIQIDSKIQDTVKRVDRSSPASKAGVRASDRIHSINGQPVHTYADMTRVLELAPEKGSLELGIERDDEESTLKLRLPAGWRIDRDPSWRSSTGAVGPASGIWGVRASDAQRRALGVNDDALALRVTYIWAPWAKASGIKLGDFVVAIDDVSVDMNIRQFQAYLHLNRNWGDRVTLTVVRGNRPMRLPIQFPNQPPN